MAIVIVFGPTGNIASVAAQTAQTHGAKCVQADLTKPDTVAAAVKTSGATHAFIYVALGSPDHMKGIVEALKTAGITFVVFLSSFTIGRSEPAGVEQSEAIAYIHARVEVSLDEVYGAENYAAIRPGGFATNLLRCKSVVVSGDVKMYGPRYRMDRITPGDMGRVSAAILAQGLPKDGKRNVFLYGTQILSYHEWFQILGEVLGKEIKVSGTPAEQALGEFVGHGVPRPLAEFMIRRLGDDSQTADTEASSRPCYEEGVGNVIKYTGKPAAGFREWAEANRENFQVRKHSEHVDNV